MRLKDHCNLQPQWKNLLRHTHINTSFSNQMSNQNLLWSIRSSLHNDAILQLCKIQFFQFMKHNDVTDGAQLRSAAVSQKKFWCRILTAVSSAVLPPFDFCFIFLAKFN